MIVLTSFISLHFYLSRSQQHVDELTKKGKYSCIVSLSYANAHTVYTHKHGDDGCNDEAQRGGKDEKGR